MQLAFIQQQFSCSVQNYNQHPDQFTVACTLTCQNKDSYSSSKEEQIKEQAAETCGRGNYKQLASYIAIATQLYIANSSEMISFLRE